MKRSILAGVVLVWLAAQAPADYYDPPEGWADNPYFTHQVWEFMTSNPVPLPEVDGNPYGQPSAAMGGDTIWILDPSAYVPTDRRGMWVVGGFNDPTAALMELYLPNDPSDLRDKYVWLQLVYFIAGAPGAAYQAALTVDGGETVSVVPGSEVAYPVPGESGWFYFEKMWHIDPQPGHEWIDCSIALPAGAVFALDEAAVDTICVPEPATLALTALGAAAAALMRRRR